MLPEAQVAHELPGRIRIRIPSRRRDDAFFADVAARAAHLAGIEGVETNALTGAIVLNFRGQFSDIAADFERTGLFRLVSLHPAVTSGAAQLAQPFQRVDRSIRSVSAGELGLPMLAGLVLLGLAGYQANRGHVLGPAVTLIFQALTMFSLSQKASPGP